MFTPRQKRRSIYLATLLLVASAVALPIATWKLPLPATTTNLSLKVNGVPPATTSDRTARRVYDDFESIVERSFQRPLFDPPPPPVPEPEPPPAPVPPQIQVVATMIDASGNQAIFQDAGGRNKIGSVGDTLSGGEAEATVLEISESLVAVEYQGQRFELDIPQ